LDQAYYAAGKSKLPAVDYIIDSMRLENVDQEVDQSG
jgi:hypothetical protein